jgi:hypothetical protein
MYNGKVKRTHTKEYDEPVKYKAKGMTKVWHY